MLGLQCEAFCREYSAHDRVGRRDMSYGHALAYVSRTTCVQGEMPQGLLAQVVAQHLGRWSPGGASAERMYRTLTDPGYKRSTNKHGRRLNPRRGIPMHAMAAFALRRLDDHEGNLNQMSEEILVRSAPECTACMRTHHSCPEPQCGNAPCFLGA